MNGKAALGTILKDSCVVFFKIFYFDVSLSLEVDVWVNKIQDCGIRDSQFSFLFETVSGDQMWD